MAFEGAFPSAVWPTSTDLERGSFVGASAHAEVAVIVVTYNSGRDISRLIDGLRVAACAHTVRLIVVDNESADDTVGLLRAEDDVLMIESGGNLGYSGGINVGLAYAGSCDSVLFLNPDVALAEDTMTRLLEALDHDGVGAVVPLILNEDGSVHPTLFREPSLVRCLCDAVLGRNVCSRIGLPSESDIRPESYGSPHSVDWAMGAALLVPDKVVRDVGNWNEAFFLYSEDVDYMRRIRNLGLRIEFEPNAMVKHRGGGSGSSADLEALKAVNRVRYIESIHGRAYSAAFRATVLLRHGLRSYDTVHRHSFAILLSRGRWRQLAGRMRYP